MSMETIKGGRGQNLIPWPNRIRDGRYTFNGVTQQLALTEPARHNASHGLARYVPWVLVERQADTVVNRVRIHPQPGWPGTLEATITHRVGEEGLLVTVEATNLGNNELPFGYGAHPYLTVGESSVDEVALTVPAASYLEVDDRLLPAKISPVDGTAYDLRRSTVLGTTNLDTAMTDLDPRFWMGGGGSGWRAAIVMPSCGAMRLLCGPKSLPEGPTEMVGWLSNR